MAAAGLSTCSGYSLVGQRFCFYCFLALWQPGIIELCDCCGEASAGASFSPVTLIILVSREVGLNVSLSVRDQLAAAYSLSFVVYVLWRTWRGRSAEQGLAVVFWGYVLQALNFRVWYATWPFPWLLLDGFAGERRAVCRLHAGLWFLVTSQLSVIIYGHFRISFLGGSQFMGACHWSDFCFSFCLSFWRGLQRQVWITQRQITSIHSHR